MHPLTLLTVGMYGKVLPNQNGAPVRVVIPWKYGFKSAKSIVRIRLTDTEPKTAWNKAAPQEYGFYSNVNPTVDHPRWSQATERRIGEFRRRQTLHVQRLRRSGRVALHRDGPQEELLSVSSGARAIALKVGVWLVGLAPLASLAYWFWTDDLTANPIELRHANARRLGAAPAAGQPGHDAAAPGVRPRLAADAAPAARSLRLRLRRPALQRVDRARPLLRLAHDGRRHRQAAVDHGGRGGAGAADARWPPRRPPG